MKANCSGYCPYADAVYYSTWHGGGSVPVDELIPALRKASRHIDTLTYNRIVKIGFDNLTPFQRDIIREVCCRQADFETDNADIIDSALSGYSINGVSVNFSGNPNMHIENGVMMPMAIYSTLAQTGLTCRLAV